MSSSFSVLVSQLWKYVVVARRKKNGAEEEGNSAETSWD
jgi:hypothetical protein